MIAISSATQSLWDKEVARNLAHRFQNVCIADVILIAQAFDHALAGNAVFSLKAGAR